MGAFVFVNLIPKDGNRVEDGVYGTERTYVFAEWPVDHDGKNNCYDQDQIFPGIQPSDGAAQCFI